MVNNRRRTDWLVPVLVFLLTVIQAMGLYIFNDIKNQIARNTEILLKHDKEITQSQVEIKNIKEKIK